MGFARSRTGSAAARHERSTVWATPCTDLSAHFSSTSLTVAASSPVPVPSQAGTVRGRRAHENSRCGATGRGSLDSRIVMCGGGRPRRRFSRQILCRKTRSGPALEMTAGRSAHRSDQRTLQSDCRHARLAVARAAGDEEHLAEGEHYNHRVTAIDHAAGDGAVRFVPSVFRARLGLCARRGAAGALFGSAPMRIDDVTGFDRPRGGARSAAASQSARTGFHPPAARQHGSDREQRKRPADCRNFPLRSGLAPASRQPLPDLLLRRTIRSAANAVPCSRTMTIPTGG